MKKIYFLLLSCTLLSACKNPQRERLKELQDAANVWNVYNTCLAVMHTSIFLDQDDWREQLPAFCAYNISKMDSFSHFKYQNDTLDRLSKAYVARFRNYLSYLQAHKRSDEQSGEAMQKASSAMDSLMQYTVNRYALNRFTPLREASYNKAMDKNQFRNYLSADKIKEIKNDDWRSIAKLIRHAAETSSLPNQRAIAWLDYANLYEQNRGDFREGEDTVSVKVYGNVAFSNEYNLFKFEAWRRWRCIYQLTNYGPDKNAFIYNKFYDSMRFISMKSLSNRLEEEPMDSLAINQYLLFVTHGPILRYGEITEGNQVLAELQDLFDYVPKGNSNDDTTTVSKATTTPKKKVVRVKSKKKQKKSKKSSN